MVQALVIAGLKECLPSEVWVSNAAVRAPSQLENLPVFHGSAPAPLEAASVADPHPAL